MIKAFVPSLLLVFSCIGYSNMAAAQAQLSGTPAELREFLFPRPNIVNINGEGELTAYKDVAKVSLMVTTEERSLNAAMSANQALRIRLIDDFVAAGIPASEINNSRFSSSPQFGLFGRNLNRYEVTARLGISVSSEEHLQVLAAAADANEEVEFETTEFEHSLEDDFEDQVRALALQDVMEKKAFYESNLDIQLKAINFFYARIQQMARVMPMAQLEAGSAAFAANSNSITAEAAPAVAPGFDEVEYQTSLTVVFEIIGEQQQGN